MAGKVVINYEFFVELLKEYDKPQKLTKLLKDAKTNMSRDIIDKLPLLSLESKELPTYDIYNFKSRRFTTRKKKVLLDRTID